MLTTHLRVNELNPEGQFSGWGRIGDTLREYARRSPHNAAILFHDDASLSYSELQTLINDTWNLLFGAGFGRRSRIGISISSFEFGALATVLVVSCSIAVPIDPRLLPEELKSLLGRLRLDAIVLLRGDFCPMRKVAEALGLKIIELSRDHEGSFRLESPLVSRPAESFADGPDFGDIACILQTSGTTRLPKLTPISRQNVLASAERLKVWLDLSPSDRCLSVASPYYSHGLTVTVFTPLLTGGSIAFPKHPMVLDIESSFRRLKPTWYSASPTLHQFILDKARGHPNPRAMHCLRFILSGGMKLSEPLRNALEGLLGAPVLDHYGSTETAQLACNCLGPRQRRAGTCGKPWPGTLMIVGDDGEQVPPGIRGEILASGPTVISGYLDDPDANRSAFIGGWLRTGDIGSLDREGFLTIHDRKKDLINRGGQKISPAEIDEVLMQHPAVIEAAAFPVTDPRLGEDIAVAIVQRPNAALSFDEIRSFLADRLAPYKIPNRIFYFENLPKGATGKISRQELSNYAAPLKAKQLSAQLASTGSLALERQLLPLWQRVLKSKAITMDDNFFDAGGDSLQAVEILAELEHIVGHPVASTVLFEAPTVRQLIRKLAGELHTSVNFIHLNAKGSKRPLVVFHGEYENNSPYFLIKLARNLGSDQPLIGISSHTGREGIPKTIEGMAVDRLPLIQKLVSQEPYRIAGYCNGAMVALETTRLLLDCGREVELLALIDPPSAGVRKSMKLILSAAGRISPKLATWLWKLAVRTESASLRSPVELWKYLSSKPWTRTPNSESYRQYQTVMARYHPAGLDVRSIYYAGAYDGRPWQRLLPRMEIFQVGSDHNGIVGTQIDRLGRHLQTALNSSGGKSVISVGQQATAAGETAIAAKSSAIMNRAVAPQKATIVSCASEND
jgi:acyl-CoA synthetase (AMP-forming)/AMP-acid ligase II/thioesterase domain-containing protein/acyl carrier protein